MNKDDMSDDAEFDAFLKGEGDLSRRLQAMPQAAPSAALDAAILARARAAMEQEARPAAANDPGTASAGPRLTPSFGQRLRIPMGIAAALVAGVFASRGFDEGSMKEEQAMAPGALISEDSADLKDLPAAPPSPPAAEAAPPAPKPIAENVVAPHEKVVAPQKAMEAKRAARAEEYARSSSQRRSEDRLEAQTMAGFSAPPPPAAAAKPASPAPIVAAPEVHSVQVPAPAPAPAPIAAAAPPPILARTQSPQAPLKEEAGVAQRKSKVEITGSRIKRDSTAWLQDIERLLIEGNNESALKEWEKFRVAYPTEVVGPELEAKLKALEH